MVFWALGLLVAFLPLVGCAGTQALKRRVGPKYEAETRSWIAMIEQRGGSGMWLVTRGYHTGDDVIAVATNSPLSHASILDLQGKTVIEAIGKGVIETPLDKFLRESHRLVLVQPNTWTPERGRVALAKARAQMGKKYDYLGVVGLPARDSWYCSELAAWSMGIEVNRKGPKHVLHPRHMQRYGAVLFDSGQRDGKPDKPDK